ncbi:uncharacterized protein LOC134206423 [Armigeres subalbatus]|uniref:uncharacterized protein LOC134206423 n=1 Tax=Armigeres subalbatus TaxID=124917 RepID=UPI002ED37C6F
MMQILIDSGSNKNIIDGETWKRLKAQGVVIKNSTTNVDHQFRGYGMEAKPMKVLGMFDSTVVIEVDNSQPISSEARFYVVDNGNQPLLGKETAKELNVLRLGLPKQEASIRKNGEVEHQNRSLLKRLQISCALKRNWRKDLDDYLMMYYSTPHSTTGKTPTELLTGRTIRTKIPSLKDIETAPSSEDFRDRDWIQKYRSVDRENANRHAKASRIELGDTVLMQNLTPGNKLSTTYGQAEYTVLDKEGSHVTIQSDATGKTFQRNTAHLKKIDQPIEGEVGECSGVIPAQQIPPTLQSMVQGHPSIDDTTHSLEVNDSQTRPKRTTRRPMKYDDYVEEYIE